VSFRTLDDGKARIVAETVRDFRPRPGSIRALQVPFTVGADRLIEVASIIESRVIEINVGTYQLFFQAGFDEHEVMWCDFSFLETEKPTFAILKADGELNIPDELSLSAIAAT
jgi:hypothetical protein